MVRWRGMGGETPAIATPRTPCQGRCDRGGDWQASDSDQQASELAPSWRRGRENVCVCGEVWSSWLLAG